MPRFISILVSKTETYTFSYGMFYNNIINSVQPAELHIGTHNFRLSYP